MAKTRIIDFLLEEKILSPEQLEAAQGEEKLTGVSLTQILVAKGWVSAEQLAQAVAKKLKLSFLKLSEIELDPQVVRLIPEDVSRRFKVVAVKMEGDDLHVAFSNPLNLPAVDELKLLTGCPVRQVVATEKEIEQAIAKYFRVQETSKQAIIDLRMQRAKEKKEAEEEPRTPGDAVSTVEETPVVRLVNQIVHGAINASASDIHLEPQEPEMVVRYRVDGILHDVMHIPHHVEQGVVSRIKILSNMDITERRRSQDGHISISRDGKDYDIRVSTLLAIGGEKIVMRILDRGSMLTRLDQLGLEEDDRKLMDTLIHKPYGMILVTGPTGSGKTTTLNAVLSQLDSIRSNIITVEDPVEYRVQRVTQVQVDSGVDMTFANALRTILRQDPDVIMVGEIRDKETAEIAIQAALTGHLVLSTLHTNDAASAVTRLIDMGVEPFLISSTVVAAVAQRLARAVCHECKEQHAPTPAELSFLKQGGLGASELKDLKLARGRGCDFCFKTGFKGRAAIYEILKVSDTIRGMIVSEKDAAKIKEAAVKEGMRTLQWNGMRKILSGTSTPEEIKRVVYVE
ncbi:MAG: type II/IV secretion system protein [Candidatus Omnitrophica bacterium]|nr:type II/IV secretion system protein [Candidatus Omnitrophota bacterium]